MLIAKIENDSVTKVADYREWFRLIPSEEELRNKGFLRVSVFVAHDRLTEKLESCDAYIDGDLVYTVKAAAMTDDEIAAAKQSALVKIRADRNRRLADCDWVTVKSIDTGAAVPQEWAEYRQTLRNLPSYIEENELDPRTFDQWPGTPS